MTERKCKTCQAVTKYTKGLVVSWGVVSFGCGMLLMGLVFVPKGGNLELDALEPCQNTFLVR